MGLGYEKYQAYISWTWVPALGWKRGLARVLGWCPRECSHHPLDLRFHSTGFPVLGTFLGCIFLNFQPGRSYGAHLVTGVPWHQYAVPGLGEPPHRQSE